MVFSSEQTRLDEIYTPNGGVMFVILGGHHILYAQSTVLWRR